MFNGIFGLMNDYKSGSHTISWQRRKHYSNKTFTRAHLNKYTSCNELKFTEFFLFFSFVFFHIIKSTKNKLFVHFMILKYLHFGKISFDFCLTALQKEIFHGLMLQVVLLPTKLTIYIHINLSLFEKKKKTIHLRFVIDSDIIQTVWLLYLNCSVMNPAACSYQKAVKLHQFHDEIQLKKNWKIAFFCSLTFLICHRAILIYHFSLVQMHRLVEMFAYNHFWILALSTKMLVSRKYSIFHVDLAETFYEKTAFYEINLFYDRVFVESCASLAN